MASEEETSAEESEENPLETLQSQTKKQLTILFAACASTLIFLICLGINYLTLNGKILTATNEPLMEMKNLSGLVSDEYTNLNMAVEFYNHQMNSLEEQLNNIDPSIDQERFDELNEILISQERDFRIFLASSQDAMHGLSEMVSGSRSWREDFKSKLDLAITTSEARELKISREIEDSAAMEELTDETSAP